MSPEDFPFVYIGNNAAVDFVNTEIQQRGVLTDLLRQPGDLARWLEQAGFAPGHRPGAGDLVIAKELRGALREAFLARVDGRPAPRAALEVINGHLAKHGSHQRLRITEGHAYELVPDDGAQGVGAILALLAHEGARLLVAPDAERLKHCGNPDCVLLFVDTSRGGKRRWCSMETCGNRAKVARHYRKGATGSP